MYKRIFKDNRIFGSKEFKMDRYKYYIALKIVSSSDSNIYSDENNYIVLQSNSDTPIWIWTKDNIDKSYINEIFECINKFFNSKSKITCKQEFYDLLLSNKIIPIDNENYFEMGSLYCEKTIEPKVITGIMEKAADEDIDVIAEYWKDDNLETENNELTIEDALKDAKTMVDDGNTYLLKNDNNKIVCMASYNFIEDVAKINHVYTPIEERKKGYCANLIYNLSNLLLKDKIVPMLYTDYNYIPSNKSYMNVGYVKSGTLVTFKLKEDK